jgi:hypothetical protein
MPEWMSPAQEKDWKESVKIVEKGKDKKKKKKFKDQDWGLAMHIWKLKEKKHRPKKKKKKKKSEMILGLISFANMLDEDYLFAYADRVDDVISRWRENDSL